MQRDVLHDAVALVEDSNDCDALRHGRDAALSGRRRGRLVCRSNRLILLFCAAPATGEAKRKH
jgi:hypothetical protein